MAVAASADVRTGTTSKSTKSSQFAIHSHTGSSSASMSWKHRSNPRSTQLVTYRRVSASCGLDRESDGTLDRLTRSEALYNHEQHDRVFRRLPRRIGRFPQLAHPGSRVKGVFNRGIWTSVASARRHSRRTKKTAPLSPRWQSKQPNATTSPDTASELSRRRQIPPFAAVYTREPSGVRQRSVGGDPLRKKCSDPVR